MVNVAIVMPSGSHIHAPTVVCLTEMLHHSIKSGVNVRFINPRVSVVEQGRWLGVKTVLKDVHATHILWLDSDMMFPKDTLTRLLKYDKDVVGAAYVKRDGSGEVVATDVKYHQLKEVPDMGIKPVGILGMGVLLTRVDVFRTLQEPWFEVWWRDDGQWVSEDAHFFMECKRHGITAWMDCALSHEIGHLGVIDWRMDE